MQNLQIITKLIFSIVLAYFATSIILLTLEIGKTRKDVPVILKQVEELENNLSILKVVTTVNDVTKEVKEVRKEIPNILKEVEELRKTIPDILKQVEATNKNIPPILEEVKQTRESLPSVLKESEQIRKSIPPILNESQEIRKDLPEILTRTEAITNNMENIAKEAGSGAIKGTVKGIFTLPGDIIRGTGKRLSGDEEPDEKKEKEQ